MNDAIGDAFEEAMRRHAHDPRAAVRYVLLRSGLPMSRQRAIEEALTKTVCSFRTLNDQGHYVYCVHAVQHRGDHANRDAKGRPWTQA